MAGYDMSNRDLWQFITCNSLTRPKDLVGEEINKNEVKLKLGLKFYKEPKGDSSELLSKEKKLDAAVVEFLKKLSVFICLDELQSHDLYKLYLSCEYRGSSSDLQNYLNSDRHTQALLSKIRDYFFNERLYLLRSIKHVLSYWQENNHPFYDQYRQFAIKLFKTEDFANNILEQYDQICEKVAPTWETHGKYMNDRHSQIWLMQNLREQCELLEIMLLYYAGAELQPPALLDLANKFKRQGFGRRQTNKHLIGDQAEPLLTRIGFLQVVLLIECLDMEDLFCKYNEDTPGEHLLIKCQSYEQLEQFFESLGQCQDHGPLLLAWATVSELGNKGDEMKMAALGNKALSVKVFPYLVSRLKMEPFFGKSVVAKLCYTIIYGLMSTVLLAFHQDTLGDREGLQNLTTILLKQTVLAEDFWKQDIGNGLRSMFEVVFVNFPLELEPLVNLFVSLAQASPSSSQMVIKVLQNLETYMEVMTNASDVKATTQQNIWQLIRNRLPYQAVGGELLIPSGTLGEYHQLTSSGVVQWQFDYDAFDVFTSEVNLILQQISHGQGMVQIDRVHRVLSICQLFHALLSTDSHLVETSIPQTAALVPLLYQLINRFSQVHPPPLDLLATAVKCVHHLAVKDPIMCWRRMQQTGFLPSLTENIDDFAEVSSGSGLNVGMYGSILAAYECTHGQYPLTLAFLDMVASLIQPLNSCGEVDMLLASIMYITREVFPVFSKWRYYSITHRELIGQKCLEIFHKVLNILGQDKERSNDKVTVRDLCLHSLLYSEAGQALLDIVSTSVDTVNMSLASQSNATEGVGLELIQMIRTAFSVLNRLLLLRPPGSAHSPVEHSLSAQGLGIGGKKNTMATIAQYIYHRHDPRLPILATVLLKRLAMIFPMSILACLGDEAEPIRDVFLSRLQSDKEDVRLKVVILEFLSTCVDTQPGLIEIFLNVKTVSRSIQPTDKQTSQDETSEKLSCLETVLSLIADKKQGTYECPSQLLSAAIEFIHALWHGHREVAMVILRKKPGFWHSVCLSLTRELQSPEEAQADITVLQKEVKSCSHIMKILALELYNNQGSNLDYNLKIVLGDILSNGRLLYWSQYLCESMQWSSVQFHDVYRPDDWTDNSTLQLLYAWRNLLLVLTHVNAKVNSFAVPDSAKEKILSDILQGIKYQFSNSREMTALNMKMASIASACYLTLLQHWVSNLDSWSSTLTQIEGILSSTLVCCASLIPSVQIALLGALMLVLQHVRRSNSAPSDQHLASLVPIVCSLLQQNTYQLTIPSEPVTTVTPAAKQSTDSSKNSAVTLSVLGNKTSYLLDQSILHSSLSAMKTHDLSRSREMDTESAESSSKLKSQLDDDIEVKLKLQTSCLSLLEELVLSLSSPEYWLPEIQQCSLLQTLLSSIESWINAHQGAVYVHTVFMLMLNISKHPQGAESLAVASFIQQLCLIVSQLYNQSEPSSSSTNLHNVGSEKSITWPSIYCLSITLYSSLLTSLKYNFLKYALEFVGVHQDRMHQCLLNAGVLLRSDVLEEAAETCHFLSELSVYRREWRLQLTHVLQKLMNGMCSVLQTCISILIRPNLLQHILQKQRSGHDLVRVLAHDKYLSTPLIRSMSLQPDDSEHPTQDAMLIQSKLLSIVCYCLASLKKFSPDICEIILDQSLDIGEYEAFLQIAFSTPSIEQDSGPTFGMMVSCVSFCLFLLNKMDAKTSSSPARLDSDKHPIDKQLIMFVLENALYLIMSQALRWLKDPSLNSRDKQLLKRELSAELNSFLSGMHRYFRRGNTAHQVSALTSPLEPSYLKLVDVFVRQVLR